MLMILPIFAVLIFSCKIYIPHPGSVDTYDSAAYDLLVVAQSVLDQAKIQFNQGKLPTSAKQIINNAGTSYNLLRDAWLAYRAVQNPDKLKALQNAMAAVNGFLADLRKLGVL
jgi:ABC-type transporter lipoprotein component MlaA